MKHTVWDAFPRWMLTWLICLALDLGVGTLLHVDGRWWLAALVLLVWCAALAVTEYFGSSWAMLAPWAVAVGLTVLLSDRGLLAETALTAVSRTGVTGWYGELLLLLLGATAALLFSVLLRHYEWRLALSLAWAAIWITAALCEWTLPRLVPAAMLPLLLLTAIETGRRLRYQPEAEAAGVQQRTLLLALLPTVLLLMLLPTSPKPYGYPLVHAIIDKVDRLWQGAENAMYYRDRGQQQFGLSFNGISDQAQVSQGVEKKDAGIIYALPGEAPYGATYLFGNAWDRFDGQRWSTTLEPEAAELLNWKLDSAEHIFALWRQLGAERAGEFTDYFRRNNVYLNCRNLNVRTMFSVMNATHIHTDDERYPYADTPTGILFDYTQKKETWYRIYYLESNARTRDGLIAASEGTEYDAESHSSVWRRVMQDFYGRFHSDLPDDVNLEGILARRTELIRSVYLDTTGVSDRAADLAKEITADCSSDYERLNAIAAYLQANYAYTLEPEPAPEGENFLDWLLFERREGYCAWYATAAVLMARSVGVPARYVQGYLCSEMQSDVYTVLGAKDAHAWCEGYVAGYGWVTVEATPGFGGDAAGWLTAAEEQALHPDDPDAPIPGEVLPGGQTGDDDPLSPLNPEDPDKDKDNDPDSPSEPTPARSGWLAAIVAVVVAAALAAVWLKIRARRKRRYAQATPTERLLMDLEKMLRDLRGKGYPRQPEEAMGQYFARLPWHILVADKAEAEEMAALYDRTFFALQEPTEEELAKHRSFAARFRPRTLRQWVLWYGLQ